MQEQYLFKTLNTIFTNEDYLFNIAMHSNGFDYSDLMHSLNIILCYYLTTRDRRILSYDEIYSNYSDIKDMLPSSEHLNNILINGYLTHSFPGIEKKYVLEYGVDYFDKLSASEKNKLKIIRNYLSILEENLGECRFLLERKRYNSLEIVEKELFVTFPGAKTIYYSIFCPERLYYGPINRKLFKKFPIVVGESKKDYLLRIIKYEIKNCTGKKIFNDDILKISEYVLDYYCAFNPCIAFIDINQVKYKPIYTGRFYDGIDVFESFYKIMMSGKYTVGEIFTSKMNDTKEFCNKGNYVTDNSYIDKKDISLVEFPDWYNLRQSYLKQVGLPEGTMVSYCDCTEIKKTDGIHDEIKKLYKSRG